jgi:acyl transferase domain-containing protein
MFFFVEQNFIVFQVPVSIEDFDKSHPSIVSVNSFGYGGTNAHAVLQDTISFLETKQPKTNGHSNSTLDLNADSSVVVKSWDSHWASSTLVSQRRIFFLSAFDEKGILSSAEALAGFLQNYHAEDDDSFLDDLAYTLSCRRTRFNCSVAVHASSKQELIERLQESTLRGVRPTKNAALGFIFTGQGAQWWGMGRELFSAFPVFSRSMQDSGDLLKKLGAEWDLRGVFSNFSE